MNVGVFLQVLRKRESLEAEHADMLLNRLVRSNMSSQRKARGIGLVATCHFAFIRSFHLVWCSLFLVDL